MEVKRSVPKIHAIDVSLRDGDALIAHPAGLQICALAEVERNGGMNDT